MRKNLLKTMDFILVFLAVFLLIFTAIMIALYCFKGGIPDTLCTCVFGICGGECGVMGWIKTTKDKHMSRQYELEDRADRKIDTDTTGERPMNDNKNDEEQKE